MYYKYGYKMTKRVNLMIYFKYNYLNHSGKKMVCCKMENLDILVDLKFLFLIFNVIFINYQYKIIHKNWIKYSEKSINFNFRIQIILYDNNDIVFWNKTNNLFSITKIRILNHYLEVLVNLVNPVILVILY